MKCFEIKKLQEFSTGRRTGFYCNWMFHFSCKYFSNLQILQAKVKQSFLPFGLFTLFE